MASLLQMSDIVVRYGSLLANDHISFDLNHGEIHALLGENGAGKSTLMKALVGLVAPESGTIAIDGQPVAVRSPVDAQALGIGMVHQHFMLIPTLTVAQNVCLGVRASRRVFPNLPAVSNEIRRLAERYQLQIDPSARVGDLSVGQQQRVEIIKALYRGARVLVLDEPTSVLTPQETEGLFGIIRHLADDGTGVIFISHKLNEVLTISDRITVLRAGKHVETRPKAGATVEQLANAMVGRDVHLPTNALPLSANAADVLRVEGLSYTDARGVNVLRDIALTVRAGEVHGIAGVDGNGQDELARVLAGLLAVTRGRIWLNGQDVTTLSPAGRIRAGLAHIPGDRQHTALLMGRSLADNAVIEQVSQPPFSRFGLLRSRKIDQFTRSLIETYSIRSQSTKQAVGTLSGGNQQKLVLARELARNPKLIIAMQPTRGLDIGATAFVHAALLEQCRKGAGLLLISTELDEVLALAHRVSVMYNGSLTGTMDRAQATRDRLGLQMGGQRDATAPVG